MQTKADQTPRPILIVDDNPDIHQDFKAILGASQDTEALDRLEAEIFDQEVAPAHMGFQYRLSFASQGREALQMVKESVNQNNPFQLAFVDMRMPPGWDGLETILRIWNADPRIQIVLCTAYSDYSWEQIGQRLVHTENLLILRKPFDISEVAQMASTLTQKWLLTEAVKARQEDLEAMVRRRTRELQATNDRLEAEMEERQHLAKQLIRAQKMEAIGTLAAGVAHDLNNILSGIVSYPDLLLQLVPPEDPMTPKLQLIQQSGRKAAAIVQDMLTLGRRAVPKQEKVDMKKVVDEYVQSPEWAKTQLHHANISIETHSAPNLSRVIGSEIQIVKSLMNLVSNAAEAMPNGGNVTISLDARHLDQNSDGYETIPAGDYVVLAVADTGEGISGQDLEHIFEPFYTKKKMGRSGTGLGLAVVWGAVRDHNAYLDVKSESGKGTIFELYFPDNGEKIDDSTTSASTKPQKGNGAHILVVDDVIEQRQIAVEMLTALGYKADTVASGEEALEYLEKQSVDMLLLDMAMEPGIDGLETYQRALDICPTQRAIIASGFTKNERVNEALALGASSFLHKPYRLKDLAEAVKAALSK